jgi:hypothetical protein
MPPNTAKAYDITPVPEILDFTKRLYKMAETTTAIPLLESP